MNRYKTRHFNRFNFSPLHVLSTVVLLGTLGTYSPAHADLKVCNNTSVMVGVSVGYRLTKGWITEGWWRIPANVCTSVFKGDLNSRYFYLHAEDAETGGRWRGPVFMCTSSKQFKIGGLKDCFTRGFERTGFFEVDTGDQKNWQVRLTEAGKSKKEADSK
ncbi:MAG: DUF1036 domain-containing protein [Rhizobiaceae bacterium]